MELEFCCNYTECRLTKEPNYILVNFNKKCTYVNGFENNYRPNIYSIVLDGVEREKNEQLDVKKGSKMKIHFTAPLTDFSNFFSSQYDTNVKNIISMDFSNFNSSLIDKFSSSFKGCTSLQSFDFSSFTISSETDISNMFEDCSSLAAINLSNFDLTNNEINNIFKNLGQIRYVNLLNYSGKTKDIYTFLNNLRDLSNSQRFICLDETQFNDVDSYYKESNNGESIENEFEICCNFDFEDFKCGYLLVSFITESTYENGFENEYRANIDKIILNGVKKTKNEALEIPAGSKMKIYFSSVPSSFKEFFSADNDDNAENIDSIDFSHMDLSEVTDMSYLFDGCTSLESVTFPKNTPKAINNIQDIFSGCSKIKSIDLSNFIITAEAKFTSMFSGCEKLIAIDLPKISTFTGETFLSLFDEDETPPLKYMGLYSLSPLDSQLLAMDFCFFFIQNSDITNCFIGLDEESYSIFLEAINDKKILIKEEMHGVTVDVNLERCDDFNHDTLECEILPTSITFNSQELEPQNPSGDSGDGNYIVVYFNDKIDYSNSLNSYRTNVTKIVVNGEEINLNDSFTIQSGTGFEIHFDEPVESLEHFFDSIIDENAAFISSIGFSYFDSSKLSNMNSIFSGCTDLVKVDFTNMDWSNVKDIGYIFYACDSLKSIDLSNFDISKVTNMERAFQSCDSLESIIFPESCPQNVENMDYMFYYCTSLKSIDLSKFDLSKITDTYDMFHSCSSLVSVTFPESLTNVEDMGYMFSECSSLKSIDLSNIALTKVTNMNSMFENCKSLESIIFPKSGPESIQHMDSLMRNCTSLTSIDLSMFTLSENTTIERFIENCDSLVAIEFPIFDYKTYPFFDT